MSKSLERTVIIAGLVLVVGLLGLTGYLGWQSMVQADEERAARATAVARLAPTRTAAAQPPSPPPATAGRPTTPTAGIATATSVPATAPATAPPGSPTPAATRSSASPTVVASGATATPDLSGPGHVPEPDPALEAQRTVVAAVGDGGLGDRAARLLNEFYPLLTRAYAENKPELLRPYLADDAYEGYVRDINRSGSRPIIAVPVIAFRVQPSVLSNFDQGSYAINVAEIRYNRDVEASTLRGVRTSTPYRQCRCWFLLGDATELSIEGSTSLPDRFCDAGWPAPPTPTKE